MIKNFILPFLDERRPPSRPPKGAQYVIARSSLGEFQYFNLFNVR